jgi:hypothetical protein
MHVRTLQVEAGEDPCCCMPLVYVCRRCHRRYESSKCARLRRRFCQTELVQAKAEIAQDNPRVHSALGLISTVAERGRERKREEERGPTATSGDVVGEALRGVGVGMQTLCWDSPLVPSDALASGSPI